MLYIIDSQQERDAIQALSQLNYSPTAKGNMPKGGQSAKRYFRLQQKMVSGRKYDLRLPKQSADEAAPCGSAAAGGAAAG